MRTFLDGYLALIVERDVEQVSGTRRDPRLVRRFLHAYAQMSSQPATVNAILRRADDLPVGDGERGGPTRRVAEPYLDALRRLSIIEDVPAWSPGVRSRKRLTALPKRQLGDVSLAAALLGISVEGMMGDLETAGFLFESLAAHDLRIYAEADGASIYHYREADGRLEIDYILETTDGEWAGIEVKLGGSRVDDAAKALLALAAGIKRAPRALVVITTGSLAYTRADGVSVVPLGCLGP